MDRLIYLAMSGAKATMQRQDVLANNLANASTPGFRAEMQAFRAVPVRGDGASTRVYSLESTVGHDTRPGAVQSTGRALDVAPLGNTWLAVQALDGTEAYSRAGALQVRCAGSLACTASMKFSICGVCGLTLSLRASSHWERALLSRTSATLTAP